MAELNKVLLIGNLTRNPEIRYTQSGSAVCEFGMAINRTYTSNGEKKQDVCFVDVNVWGNQAEACNRYLQKGSSLFVEGRLNFDQWDDKETGKKRSRLRVVAERTQFLNTGRNDGGNESYGGGNSNGNGGADQFAPPPPAPANNPGTFPPPPPAAAPQAQMGINNQASSFAAPAGMPTQPAPTQAQAPAPAPPPPAAPQVPAQPTPAPVPDNNAFNTNMGSEDDIPF